jgi:hypothetical protein
VRLLGSGTILREVIAAAELLQHDWQVASDVWSATSYSELARDAREVERWNRLHPEAPRRASHVQACLGGDLPIVAASDYVRAWPQLVASHAGAPFVALGTDGFGRSDTRAELRRFFEIDRHQIVLAALDSSGAQRAPGARGVRRGDPPLWDRHRRSGAMGGLTARRARPTYAGRRICLRSSCQTQMPGRTGEAGSPAGRICLRRSDCAGSP